MCAPRRDPQGTKHALVCKNALARAADIRERSRARNGIEHFWYRAGAFSPQLAVRALDRRKRAPYTRKRFTARKLLRSWHSAPSVPKASKGIAALESPFAAGLVRHRSPQENGRRRHVQISISTGHRRAV